jgi:lipopolysaccharide cholinephosphotransferase
MVTKRQLSLNEVKDVELGILNYIDNICKKHNLKYFLAYGTLLGAIRHKGFIPWDDDIDICMKRSDYDKLISILSNENHERYTLLHHSVDSTYFYEFAKVVDTRTKIIGEGFEEIPSEGIWVDIFPLDNVAKNKKLQRLLIQICLVIRILSVYTKFPSHKRSIFFYPVWLLARLIGYRIPLKITDWQSKKGTREDLIGYIASMSTLGSKYCYPIDWFEDTVLVEFEDNKYPAPYKYHEYLSSQYGDYMQLPPEDKRVPHPVEAYWR